MIINNADNIRDRLIVELLAFTGARRGEIALLKVSHIDLENDRIFVPTIKRKGPPEENLRQIPIISPRLKQDIQTYLEFWETKYNLKPHQRLIQQDSKSKKDGISKVRINQIVSDVAKKAGIQSPNPNRKHVHPHQFRHSFVSFARRRGLNFKIIQEILGHSSISTTLDLYGAPSWAEIKEETMEKMKDFTLDMAKER